MKKVQLVTLASLLAVFSFSTYAAGEIQFTEKTIAVERLQLNPTEGKQQVGVISVLGAETPDDVIIQLAEKAEAIGATEFRLVSLTGNDNSERGTAIAYR